MPLTCVINYVFSFIFAVLSPVSVTVVVTFIPRIDNKCVRRPWPFSIT